LIVFKKLTLKSSEVEEFMFRKTFGIVIILALLVIVGMATTVSAKDYQITNNTSKNVTFSDLTLYSGQNKTGTAQVVLIANDNSDDVTLGPGQSQNLNVDANNQPLINWKSYTLSITDTKGEHQTCAFAEHGLIREFSPTTNGNLFSAIIGCSTSVSLGEDDTLAVSGGWSAAVPNVYFSTTSISYTDSCIATGTAFTGNVVVVGTVGVSAPSTVPSLTTYGLIALALLLAGTAVWMFRRRRVSVAA
jgi:hypothetical protein